MKLYSKSGRQLKLGSRVTTFRGETATIIGIFPPGTASSPYGTGRVQIVFDTGESGFYYPSVIGAQFISEEAEQC